MCVACMYLKMRAWERTALKRIATHSYSYLASVAAIINDYVYTSNLTLDLAV